MNHDPSSFARGRACPAPAPLDYRRLVAALTAHQASTRTARVAMGLGGTDRPAPTHAQALATVIEGGAGWTAATAALAGRFEGVDPAEPASIRGQRS